MGIKRVVASKSEERGYLAIEHQWANSYRLFPNLPFSAIFEPDKTIRGTSNLFYKTSVDYTLCTNSFDPIMSIDFDGLGYGYNRNGAYVQKRTTADPFRKLKFDFKLNYAERETFLYYVLSYDEFKPIGEASQSAVVQGIIGYVIANREFGVQIAEEVRRHQSSIDTLSAHEQYGYI